MHWAEQTGFSHDHGGNGSLRLGKVPSAPCLLMLIRCTFAEGDALHAKENIEKKLIVLRFHAPREGVRVVEEVRPLALDGENFEQKQSPRRR